MSELEHLLQRESIAWCAGCGNVSVDGFNFARAAKPGWLECHGCNAVGPFEYQRADHVAEVAEELAEAQRELAEVVNEKDVGIQPDGGRLRHVLASIDRAKALLADRLSPPPEDGR